MIDHANVISINNVTLEVVNKNKNVQDKYITLLNNIVCQTKSGEMVALMGPSGSGKSSLLKLLAGRVDNSSYTNGSILINNEERNYNKWFDSIGFLDQDDTVFESFTIEETITYACKFRNKNLSSSEQESLVKEIITSLELDDVKKTLMKKISGGERKRTMIAVELVSQPKILFMDEPTSGLDSINAKRLIDNLRKRVTNTNIIVFICIHQPSEEIFDLFDKLILLKKSKILYSGEIKNCEKELKDLGICKREKQTFPDFLMELASYHVLYDKSGMVDILKLLESKCYKKNNLPYFREKSGTSKKYLKLVPNWYEITLLTKRMIRIKTNSLKKITMKIFWSVLCSILIVYISFGHPDLKNDDKTNLKLNYASSYLYVPLMVLSLEDPSIFNIKKLIPFINEYNQKIIPYVIYGYLSTMYSLFTCCFSYYLYKNCIKRELNVNSFAISSYWIALILSNCFLNALFELITFVLISFFYNAASISMFLLFPILYVFNVITSLALSSFFQKKLMISVMISGLLTGLMFFGPIHFLLVIVILQIIKMKDELPNTKWFYSFIAIPFMPYHYFIFEWGIFCARKLIKSKIKLLNDDNLTKGMDLFFEIQDKMHNVYGNKRLNLFGLAGVSCLQVSLCFIIGMYVLGKRYMPEIRLKLSKKS